MSDDRVLMPRPSKRRLLSDDRHQRFIDALRLGNTIKVAGSIAGWSYRSTMRYLQRGRAADLSLLGALEQLPDDWEDVLTDDGQIAQIEALIDPLDLPYWRLWQAAEGARDEAEMLMVSTIREHAAGVPEIEVVEEIGPNGNVIRKTTTTRTARYWTAAAWWLERTRPGEYGRYTRHDVRVADETAVGIESREALKARGRELVDDLTAKRRQRALADERRPALDVGSTVHEPEVPDEPVVGNGDGTA